MTTIEQSSYFGGGYEFLDHTRRAGWEIISSWGKDGWDMGSWPLVSVSQRTLAGKYQILTYSEGDVTIETYDTEQERLTALDAIAEFYWRQLGEGPTDMARYPEGQLPAEYRGYYRRH